MDDIKKNDFIEIEYAGKVKETGKIFDLTDSERAKEEGIYQENGKYSPVVVCVGFRDVVAGLDDGFIGKKIGESFEVEVAPEKAFGKKRADLIRLVPLSVFSEKGVKPVPGVQFSFDGVIGVVRSVSGGRILVDFNHPLSGRDVIYEVKVLRKITSSKEKVESFLKHFIEDFSVEVKDGHAIIESDLDEKIGKKIIEEIKKRVPELKIIDIKKKKITASEK